MLHRRGYRPTAFMSLDHQQGHVEVGHRIFQAADAGGVQHQAGSPHHEEVTQALIENDLRRHPGIGAAEHRGFRLLALGQGAAQIQ